MFAKPLLTISRVRTNTGIDSKLVAGLYLDLKGPKKKRRDWMSIARDCQKLKKELGSPKEVAGKIGVSEQIIRAILSLNDLPLEIQEMVRRGDILFDAAYRLNTLPTAEKQIEVAKMVVGLSNHQTRDLIFQAKKFPDSDLTDFRRRLKSPSGTRRVHVAIVPLEEETYARVQKMSKTLGRPVEKILSDAITDWVGKG